MVFSSNFDAQRCNDEYDRCAGCPIPSLQREHPDIAAQIVKMIESNGFSEVFVAVKEQENRYDSFKFANLVAASGSAIQEEHMLNLNGYEIAKATINTIAANHGITR